MTNHDNSFTPTPFHSALVSNRLKARREMLGITYEDIEDINEDLDINKETLEDSTN